ncbi:SDR family oxidoreductase [Nocardia asiatica]|uniref:SDR family oxidoreductase n=1 Tax=Nocardia asiatica TaxID=209252 RepID=UPI0002E0B941|nr:SDR family oxidoreductase [Nocardia asiatica]
MRETTLAGRIVAVTGGAQGIGREIARQLAEAGAWVVIGDRDIQAAEATAQALPGQVHAFGLDVTDTGSFRRFLAEVTALWGPLDVLVNNAGVMWVGPFDNEPETATERMLAVNLHGVIRGVRLVAPPMRERGRGHIVTIASAASKLAPPGESTYAATKHAVLGYLTGVREELRGSGVEISVIMPGVVDTELAIGTDSGATSLLQPGDVAAAVVEVLRRPRFEVFLPATIGLLVRITAVLPQPIRDLVLRRTVPNQAEATRDSNTRAGYERRALTETTDPKEF